MLVFEAITFKLVVQTQFLILSICWTDLFFYLIILSAGCISERKLRLKHPMILTELIYLEPELVRGNCVAEMKQRSLFSGFMELFFLLTCADVVFIYFDLLLPLLLPLCRQMEG